MTTATTGTGTITLGSAVSGFLTFALAGVADADVVSYGIRDGANSEVGTGTYTSAGTTLTRTVTKSTNSDAAINLSGTAQVYVTARAEDMIPVNLAAATSTVMQIGSGGRVGITGDGSFTGFPFSATSLDGTPGAVSSILQVFGTGGTSSASIIRFNGDPRLIIARGGTAINDYTAVTPGNGIGEITWNGSNGTALVDGATIRCEANETWSGTANGTRMLFYTVGDTTAANTERIRINQGQVWIANPTAVPAAGGTVGTTAMALQFSSTADFGIFVGSGVPTVAAATGSLYLRTDGTSTTTRIYVRTNSATWATFTVSA